MRATYLHAVAWMDGKIADERDSPGARGGSLQTRLLQGQSQLGECPPGGRTAPSPASRPRARSAAAPHHRPGAVPGTKLRHVEMISMK
jgi:hypothetical protein